MNELEYILGMFEWEMPETLSMEHILSSLQYYGCCGVTEIND